MDFEDETRARKAAHLARQMWAKLDEIDIRVAIEDGGALTNDDRKFLASCNIKWAYNQEENE